MTIKEPELSPDQPAGPDPEGDPAPAAGLTIHQLIPRVKAAIGAVGKNRRMEEGQKYLYRSQDDMLDAAHDGLVEAGVFWVPHEAELTYTDFLTANNKKGVRCTGSVRYRMYGPMGDFLELVVRTEAQDYSDKATNKAYTVAQKVMLAQVFAIPFRGDDADDERPEREADPRQERPSSGGGQRQGNRPAQGRRDERAGAAPKVSAAKRKQYVDAGNRLNPEGQALLKAFREAEGIDTHPDRFLEPGWRKVMQKAAALLAEGYKAAPGQAPAEPEGAQDAPEPPADRPGPVLPGADRYAEPEPGEDEPDPELRDHFAERLDKLGETYQALMVQMLDAAQENSLAGADWRIQVAQLPPEWDDWLAEAVGLVESQHAQDNPPDYDEDPEGRPYE